MMVFASSISTKLPVCADSKSSAVKASVVSSRIDGLKESRKSRSKITFTPAAAASASYICFTLRLRSTVSVAGFLRRNSERGKSFSDSFKRGVLVCPNAAISPSSRMAGSSVFMNPPHEEDTATCARVSTNLPGDELLEFGRVLQFVEQRILGRLPLHAGRMDFDCGFEFGQSLRAVAGLRVTLRQRVVQRFAIGIDFNRFLLLRDRFRK